MFFLRCCFWLSIVYASMSWAPGSFHAEKGVQPIGGAQALAGQVTRSLTSGAADICLHHRAECMADAARLADLFASAAGAPGAVAEGSNGGAVAFDGDGQDTARPAPDPRRHAKYAKSGNGR